MSIKVELRLDFESDLNQEIINRYGVEAKFRIISESLDARKSNRGVRPKVLYKVEVIKDGECFSHRAEIPAKLNKSVDSPIIIIGAGPAGLFAALRCCDYGIPAVILERGVESNQRMKDIAKFWRYGIFKNESNVCFGEGGAGLFSDGKLVTRVKSPHIPYVMQRLVDFGAPESTAYLSNPHLGSNKIRKIIPALSNYLRNNGVQIHYSAKVNALKIKDNKCIGVKLEDGREFDSQSTILATGHSARDVYKFLQKQNVQMKAKELAVGVRMEHPRRLIDSLQHGTFCEHEKLSSARYRFAHHNKVSERGTYSFCMCPGGFVLSAGTESTGLVSNGMSNFARNSPWSNSAIVVSTKKGFDYKENNLFGAMNLQRYIEEYFYKRSKEVATGKELPAQRMKDFMREKLSKTLPKSSSPSGLFSTKLHLELPEFVSTHLMAAFNEYDKKLKGIVSDDALLIGPETRTSSPITILRDKNSFVSTSHSGLFPVGEGAGFAGGITSAACDGVAAVDKIIFSLFGDRD